jgi:hypothetical protein
MAVRNRKQDEAWEYLFERFDIPHQVIANGDFTITSSEINAAVREYYATKVDGAGRSINAPDARNLLKYDFSYDLPNIFRSKDAVPTEKFGAGASFNIMPMGKDRYSISDYRSFQEIEYKPMRPKIITFPNWISGIDPEEPKTINSEAVAQSVAEMSGMLNIILEDMGSSVVSTLSGKKGTGLLDFSIAHFDKRTTNFVIDGWQSEIDGVYESKDKVLIIESKQKRPDDFNIRQLFIPLLIYRNQMRFEKEIYTAYFTYTDNLFSFHVYKFMDMKNFNSLKKIKQYDFIFDENEQRFTAQDLVRMMQNVVVEEEPKQEPNEKLVPFPQANDVEKMLDMIGFIGNNKPVYVDSVEAYLQPGSKLALAETYKFDERQSDYYGNLLNYFGFATREDDGFVLTNIGQRYNQLDQKAQTKLIIEQILKRKTFREVVQLRLETNEKINNKDVAVMIAKNRKDLSTSTVNRRASTVNNIVEWVFTKLD